MLMKFGIVGTIVFTLLIRAPVARADFVSTVTQTQLDQVTALVGGTATTGHSLDQGGIPNPNSDPAKDLPEPASAPMLYLMAVALWFFRRRMPFASLRGASD